MRRTVVFALVLAVGVSFGLMADRTVNAQQEPVKRTVLLKHDITGFDGKDGSIVEAVISPGAQSGWHHHPGEEFIYIAEGSGVYEIKGQPPQTVRTGSVLYNAVGGVHNAKNTGTTPLRVIGFLVLTKGMPLTTPDNPPQ